MFIATIFFAEMFPNYFAIKSIRRGGKPQKCAKLMALGPGSGWPVGNKAINLDFWAPFLCYFLLALKESKDN